MSAVAAPTTTWYLVLAAVLFGIGTVGAVVVGILRYGESARPLRLFFVSLVLAAVVGLKLVG